MKKALKNSLILTLLIISTVFIFYLIFTKIDLIKTIESIKSVKFHYFILCVLISTFINIFVYAKIRLIIWQCLKHIISYKELLFIRLGSMPFKAIPSMKTTDIVAALYLNKFNNIPIAEGILSNIIASIFCLISLLFIFMIGYLSHLLYHIDFSQFQHYFTIMFFISILLVIFLYSFLLNQNIGKNILYNLFFRKESKHLTILQKQIETWKELPASKNILLIFYSLLFQLSELIIFYIFSKSFGLNIPISKILLYVPLIIIISQLPISLSGLGIKEGSYVIFFFSFATKEMLLALGLLVFFVNQIVPIIIGVAFTFPFINKLQISEIRKYKHAKQ